MLTMVQKCSNCDPKDPFVWRSQPFIKGKHPAGNLMLSFSMLMSGVNINQALLMFKHLGLHVITARTYFKHQNKFHFPSILTHWKNYQSDLCEKLLSNKASSWSGDGRFDSMGHSAKYGTYTMFNNETSKLFHFEILQVSFCFKHFISNDPDNCTRISKLNVCITMTI